MCKGRCKMTVVRFLPGLLQVLLPVFLSVGLVFSAAAQETTDYNKEFSDGYFRLDQSDADVHIKIYRTAPGTKVDPIGKQDSAPGSNGKKTGGTGDDDGISISALGKLLQLSLVALLGFLIYLISRRSRRKTRY